MTLSFLVTVSPFTVCRYVVWLLAPWPATLTRRVPLNTSSA